MPDLPPASTTLWNRAVSDRDFCEALIRDPLRALADTPGITATPDQVRRLEGMTLAERERAVRELVTEVAARRAREQWGDRAWTPDDDAEFDVMFHLRDPRTPPPPSRKDDDDDDDGDEEAFVS
ncbi:MAG: hypothetical protein KDC33_05980 [Thermoleophilia bacterium]|nr:hypothetical protein [Thermoleophilia bacterium]